MTRNDNIYLIEWHDAHSGSGWYRKEEVKKFIDEEKCIVRETGWIISETKDEIVLACRRLKWTEHSISNTEQWGMLQKIPKSWIRKRLLLRNVK